MYNIKFEVNKLPFPLSNNYQIEWLSGDNIYYIEQIKKSLDICLSPL